MKADKDQYYLQCSIDYKNRAKMKRCRAAIHIEDKNDEPFWSYVFSQYIPDSSFDFIAYTRVKSNKVTGSQICLTYKELGCLSKDFLIAIDSDERYLLKEKGMDAAHYVLQTYTYSIENHYCYPATINQAFLTKNKFKNTSFDFDTFLVSFSNILYPFYMYYLYSNKCQDGNINKEDFIKSWDIVPPMIIDIDTNGANYLDHIRAIVNEKITSIQEKYPTIDISSIEEEFRALGLKPENTYLYVRGHNLFDKLITSVIKMIYRKQMEEYKKSLANDEKSEYAKRLLNTDHEYFSQSLQYDYPEMMKIGGDIQSLFLTKQNTLL